MRFEIYKIKLLLSISLELPALVSASKLKFVSVDDVTFMTTRKLLSTNIRAVRL